MHAADLSAGGVVSWGTRPTLDAPGVYLVARSEDPEAVAPMEPCPLAGHAVAALLAARPELRVDGRRPSEDELAERLASMWLSEETVLYIGLASTSVLERVAAYFRTPLGARSPACRGLAPQDVEHFAAPVRALRRDVRASRRRGQACVRVRRRRRPGKGSWRCRSTTAAPVRESPLTP